MPHKKTSESEIDIRAELGRKAQIVNDTLKRLFDNQTQIPKRLKEAMVYSACGGGKRLRGAVVLWCCEMVSGEINDAAKTAAAAVEMVHAYSLIHDDLPAMDDDDMRRGRPSCHKAFDEATAILAGDGLLTLAFEVLASKAADAKLAVRLIRTLGQACGPEGMAGGQMVDLENQNGAGGMETLRYIHVNKTAKMFAASAAMGAIAGGASNEQIEKLLEFGLKLGLGFQIADDILDVIATTEQLGKTAGKDVQQGKLTYPALVGLAESKTKAKETTEQALAALEMFGEKAKFLRLLAEQLLERTS